MTTPLHFLFSCIFLFGASVSVKPSEDNMKDGFVEKDITEKSAKVDELFSSTIDAFPGASVIILRDGKILYKKSYGLADIEHNIANTSHTIFRLGSITKQFTAMAILQLHERQLLNINDVIEKYLPGIINKNKITVRHLLTHTSGIIESPDSALEFLPGQKFSYSNTGYNLLGKIIESVSGTSYENYLQENIFNPLGMEDTGYEHQDMIGKMAVGYKIDNSGQPQKTGTSCVSGAYAAGALYSTVENMYLWNQALCSETLIQKSLLEKAFTQVLLNDGSKVPYGFGWMINQRRGLKEVSHGGDIAGFNSYIAHFPTEKFTVVVLSNVEMRPPGPLPNAEQLANNIAAIFLSDKMTPENERVAIELDPEILKLFIGQYKLSDAPASVIEAGGSIYTIVQKDKRLFVRSKLGEQQIFPMTKTKFYLDNNTIINFKTENDRITGMVIDLMGLGVRIVNANKID